MRKVTINNLKHPLPQPLQAAFCSSFLCRLLGLMFRRQIPLQEGLLLVQSKDSQMDSAIHMLFCFTDLTAVWITSKYEVVDVRLAKKWAPAYIPRKPAKYVLELHPSRLGEFQIGDMVQFTNE
jgi:uncharacterized membrane protein (UPF0127 family)